MNEKLKEKLNGLYVITDDTLTPLEDLKHYVTQAIKGGARIVQLRNKTSSDETIAQTSLMLQELCRASGVLFVINDKIDIAIKLGLDGLHIGKSDHATFDEIRTQFKGILGVSCYGDVKMALDFEQRGADYVAFGSFYTSPTKPLANVVELSVLDEAKAQLSIPVCAIGGINTHNLDSVLAHEPDMICVVNDIWSSKDIQSHALHYATIIEALRKQ